MNGSHTLKEPTVDRRLIELDVLRGIAALAVVFCHFLSQTRQLRLTSFEFRWGSYGPHLFFMISGFVIFMTMNRCQRPLDFVFSRFSRLYPLYWLGVVFSSMVILLTANPGAAIGVKQFLVNLTMLQTWLGVDDIEVAYWTLGIELKFYVLMFIVLIFRKAERIEIVCGGWLLAVLVYRLVDLWFSIPRLFATPLILDYAHLFVAGILFYRLKKVGEHWLRHTLIAAVFPLGLLAEGFEVALFSTGFVGLFYLFVYGKLKWVAVGPLPWLGGISYALYLVHGSLGYAMIGYFHQIGAPLLVVLWIPMVVCLGVSWLFTYAFEQPILQWLRGWYRCWMQDREKRMERGRVLSSFSSAMARSLSKSLHSRS